MSAYAYRKELEADAARMERNDAWSRSQWPEIAALVDRLLDAQVRLDQTGRFRDPLFRALADWGQEIENAMLQHRPERITADYLTRAQLTADIILGGF